MAIDIADDIEQSAIVLAREIDRLERLGLQMAAFVVRIAYLDLQMRLHNVSEEEIEFLNQAAKAIERGRMEPVEPLGSEQ